MKTLLFRVLYRTSFIVAYLMFSIILTLALCPIFLIVGPHWEKMGWILRLLVAAGSFFTFGLVLCVLIGFLLRLPFLRPRCGIHPFTSAETMKMELRYGLLGLAQFFFLYFLRTTALLPIFYRLAGSRVGHSVFINTTRIWDPSLVAIGHRVVIGENALVSPHTVEAAGLVLEPILIGDDAIIAQYSQILPGARIGKKVTVGAGAVVHKYAQLPDETVWIGNPLRQKVSQKWHRG